MSDGSMSEYRLWEERFVNSYIQKARRDRYLTFLQGKKRQIILNRLCHTLDYDDARATVLEKKYRVAEALCRLLREHSVAKTCFLMADSNDLDGSELPLERGVRELLQNRFGAVLICPPKPIAIYKEEAIGRTMLFE